MNPAFLTIQVDGVDVNVRSLGAILVDAEIVYELNAHATCRCTYRQSPDLRFEIENWIGKLFDVKAVDSGGVELALFKGWLSAVDLNYELNGSYVLRMNAVSKSIAMDLTPQNRTHAPKKLGGHLEKLTGFSGLTFHKSYEETGPRGIDIGMLQIGETDFGFFHRMADRFGMSLRVVGDGVEALDHFIAGGTSVTWRQESGLSDFRLAGRMSPGIIQATGYDRSQFLSYDVNNLHTPGQLGPASAASLASGVTARLGLGHWQGTIADPFMSRSQGALENEVELESRRSALSQVHGIGQSREAAIRPGEKLSIQGDVDFAGDWGVLKVIHRWLPDGYHNEFVATPFTGSALAWNRPEMPKHPGVMVARVLESGNTEHLGMVKVQFPWEQEPWLWARVMTPYAGQDRGIMFLPEVGDEVLVSFEYGDTARPIVIGSMWNGVHTPPTDDVFGNDYEHNNVKRIVTKSGNRMVMDDKNGHEAIIMATPHHVRVSLFDGGSRLLLHSDGDIHINAGGTVHMKCAQFLREIG